MNIDTTPLSPNGHDVRGTVAQDPPPRIDTTIGFDPAPAPQPAAEPAAQQVNVCLMASRHREAPWLAEKLLLVVYDLSLLTDAARTQMQVVSIFAVFVFFFEWIVWTLLFNTFIANDPMALEPGSAFALVGGLGVAFMMVALDLAAVKHDGGGSLAGKARGLVLMAARVGFVLFIAHQSTKVATDVFLGRHIESEWHRREVVAEASRRYRDLDLAEQASRENVAEAAQVALVGSAFDDARKKAEAALGTATDAMKEQQAKVDAKAFIVAQRSQDVETAKAGVATARDDVSKQKRSLGKAYGARNRARDRGDARDIEKAERAVKYLRGQVRKAEAAVETAQGGVAAAKRRLEAAQADEQAQRAATTIVAKERDEARDKREASERDYMGEAAAKQKALQEVVAQKARRADRVREWIRQLAGSAAGTRVVEEGQDAPWVFEARPSTFPERRDVLQDLLEGALYVPEHMEEEQLERLRREVPFAFEAQDGERAQVRTRRAERLRDEYDGILFMLMGIPLIVIVYKLVGCGALGDYYNREYQALAGHPAAIQSIAVIEAARAHRRSRRRSARRTES